MILSQRPFSFLFLLSLLIARAIFTSPPPSLLPPKTQVTRFISNQPDQRLLKRAFVPSMGDASIKLSGVSKPESLERDSQSIRPASYDCVQSLPRTAHRPNLPEGLESKGIINSPSTSSFGAKGRKEVSRFQITKVQHRKFQDSAPEFETAPFSAKTIERKHLFRQELLKSLRKKGHFWTEQQWHFLDKISEILRVKDPVAEQDVRKGDRMLIKQLISNYANLEGDVTDRSRLYREVDRIIPGIWTFSLPMRGNNIDLDIFKINPIARLNWLLNDLEPSRMIAYAGALVGMNSHSSGMEEIIHNQMILEKMDRNDSDLPSQKFATARWFVHFMGWDNFQRARLAFETKILAVHQMKRRIEKSPGQSLKRGGTEKLNQLLDQKGFSKVQKGFSDEILSWLHELLTSVEKSGIQLSKEPLWKLT